MTGRLPQLTQLGFKRVGEWRLDPDRPRFRLSALSRASHILYAFVVDGEVKYIGKSVLSLDQRMNGYQNPGPTQRTNQRVNAEIALSLRAGAQVEIWAFAGEPLTYRGLQVDLAAGLEGSLIQALAPPWNLLR